MSTNIINAKDCKCIECGEQAVAFWPMIDPDIPHNPYCRDCLDKTKMDAMIKLQVMMDKNRN